MKLNKLFLIILLLAGFLRFYKLGEVPFSLDWDENSNAYNAYSILKTGKDEYGQPFPIANRSFDDYKPPLYMYLNVVSVALFDLIPFAARSPSAFFGTLTVPFVYLLVKKLTGKEKLALLAMFLIAISPWHIQFSRVGFESTVGLFFAVSFVWAFLEGLKKPKLLLLSGFLLGVSAYSYHSQRILIPLLCFSLATFYFKEIIKVPKKILLSFIAITVAIALPLVVLIPPKVILQRFDTTTGRPRLEDIEKSIMFQEQDGHSTISRLVHNRRVTITQTLVSNYLSHFDPNFLFTKGDDNFRHHIQNMGMLYKFELPLFILGLFLFIKNRTRENLFILSWLLIAPVAAIPATPNPHANRALPMLIPLTIINASALFYLAQKFKNLKPAFFVIISISALLYIHNYFVHYPLEKSEFWQFGYKEAVFEAEKLKSNYRIIKVDRSLEQAYAFWLFNLKVDPKEFQEKGSRYGVGKYVFESDPPTQSDELFVAISGDFPGNFEVEKTIYYPNGMEAIKIGHAK